MAASLLDQLAQQIVQAVAELPDRTSPDDWPEAMLVTSDELRQIVLDALCRSCQAEQGWRDIESAPKDGTWLLLWWPAWNTVRPSVGCWHEGRWLNTEERTEPDSNEEVEAPKRWQSLPDPPFVASSTGTSKGDRDE